MVYLDINSKNYNGGKPSRIEKFKEILKNKDTKIFVLIYMEGCGPCNATRPEWSKLKNVLSKNFLDDPNIAIVSIDKDLVGKVEHLEEANSFPTMRYVANSGKKVETYEDSDISNKDRTIDSFVEWVKSKTGEKNITKMSGGYRPKTVKKRNRTKYGGKWSAKYKRSINCRRPKGFSQRQYCKYSRKK